MDYDTELKEILAIGHELSWMGVIVEQQECKWYCRENV